MRNVDLFFLFFDLECELVHVVWINVIWMFLTTRGTQVISEYANMEVIRIFSCFLFMLPGMLSRRLSALHFSWPSFQCLMSLSSGLYYCVIGWFYLSSQWSAKSCTWSNTDMSHWILESRWASSFLKCLFSHQNIVVVLLSTFFCFQTAIVANHLAWRYCWFLC